MKLEYLDEFLVLTQTGNFTVAAKDLQITQTALSRHIQQLEAELGVTLFERSTRKMKLTHAGKIFLKYASNSIDVQKEMMQSIEEIRNEKIRYLTIATMRNFKPYRIDQLCMSFVKKHSNIMCNMVEAEAENQKDRFANEECDIGIDSEIETPNDNLQRGVRIATDSIVVLLPENHDLAKQDRIRLEQLSDERFIMMPTYSSAYRHSINICKKAGIRPKVLYTALREGDCVQMVSDGMGVSLVLRAPVEDVMARNSLPYVAIRELDSPIRLNINIRYRKDRMTPEIREFLDHAEQFMHKSDANEA